MHNSIHVDREAVYLLADAATLCGLPVSAVQAAVRSDDLPATRRGKHTYIAGDCLWRWLTGRPQTSEASNA